MKVVVARDRDGRVRAAVEEVTGGKRLDRDPPELPGLAEATGREGVVAVAVRRGPEVGPVEPEAPLVGEARRDEALAREVGGGEARHRRPAGMEALGPGSFLQELHAPRGGAEGDPLGHRELSRVEPEEPARPEGAAEGADEAGRVKALAVEPTPWHRADAGPRLHRDHVGGNHVGAGRAEPLAERKGAGKRARGRVDDPRHMGVVVVEAVDEEPVRHRRVPEGETPRVADDGHSVPVRGRVAGCPWPRPGPGERLEPP